MIFDKYYQEMTDFENLLQTYPCFLWGKTEKPSHKDMYDHIGILPLRIVDGWFQNNHMNYFYRIYGNSIQLWTLVEVDMLFCGHLSKSDINRGTCAEVNITSCEGIQKPNYYILVMKEDL